MIKTAHQPTQGVDDADFRLLYRCSRQRIKRKRRRIARQRGLDVIDLVLCSWTARDVHGEFQTWSICSTRVCRLLLLALRKQGIQFAFKSVVIEIIVQIVARLHGIYDIFLMAIFAQRLKHLERRGIGSAPAGERI